MITPGQFRYIPPFGLWWLLGILVLNGPLAAAEEEVGLPVTAVEAKLGVLAEEIPLTGSVHAIRISRISAKQEGIIESLHFDEGDKVEKGDVIAHIDSKLAELELDRTRALYNEAQARLKEARRQRDEAASLLEKKHIPLSNYENRISEVEINTSVVKRLEVEISQQQEIVRRHTVYAPFDGIITNKLVEIGQWISTDNPLLEITELDPLRIEVPVPQYYYSRIQIGTPVRIIFDALPERQFDAKISARVPLGAENARTFPVKIDIENTDQVLAPGMSARVYLQLDEHATTQALLIPRDAIVRHPGGTETVWVMREQNGQQRAAPLNVRSGRSSKGMVEIVAGTLKAGDLVIVRGNEILQPGQLVYITEDQPPAL